MATSRLAHWTVPRLRGLLLLFFIALAIPTVILFIQAYGQLKWEAFHQHRMQAEELVQRIDQRYQALIEQENARNFTDYAFFKITGDLKANLLQRSKLSRFPIEATIPGTLGYFQIDHKGRFSTPLLPNDKIAMFRSGLKKQQMQQRRERQNELYALLSNSHVVARPPFTAPLPQVQEAAADTAPSAILSQSGFDQLQQRPTAHSDKQAASGKSLLGKVEDLKLEKRYEEQLSLQEEKSSYAINKRAMSKSKKDKPSRRKEQSILPQARAPASGNASQQPARLSIFESEIDTLEFAVLDSGHFILYRKVWRNEHRYIQGMLLDATTFINQVIRDSFYQTSLSQASNLAIAWQGDILSALNSRGNPGYLSSSSELRGSLLLQDGLSAPFDQLQLIFSVNELPAGPGGSVMIWTSIVVVLVFCSGFFLIYRLALRQLILVRQQQDFVSAVSHELKTPLTSIRMYGEILKQGWADEEKRHSYYEYIYDESERLTRLINNLLQLARMTRNELHADLRLYSVRELLDNLLSKLNSQAEHSGFVLNIECDDESLEKEIEVDADYFSQIFINLVDNAIKFSARAEKKQIDIHCRILRDGSVEFCLRDYGPGIARDQLRKIFQLFYRSENELTRETIGTGIGLALVRQLLDLMHARIDAVNHQIGVEFRLSFVAHSPTNTN